MQVDVKNSVRIATAFVLAAVFAVPSSLMAQATAHVVSPSDLQKAAAASTQSRQRNVQTVQEFLTSPRAEKALKSAHVNLQQVKDSVSKLSDGELAQMASRAVRAQTDFAAGSLSDRDLIFIILGIAALVLIIVAVR